MTLSEIKAVLRSAGIDNFSGEAHILIKEFCRADAALPETDFESPQLCDAVRRRAAREPLQYILGKWGFYKEEYFVTPDCLIPRADTEVLVEALRRRAPDGGRFLDLCTGSGCIAVSLANARPDLSGVAADLSASALKLARKNALHNGVHTLSFLQMDVTKPGIFSERFDCICANPPYIRTSALSALAPELAFEPEMALDGGADGLCFYRAIFENFENNLLPSGFFAFEFGYDQKEDAAALAKRYGYFFDAIMDYGGNFRAAVFTK